MLSFTEAFLKALDLVEDEDPKAIKLAKEFEKPLTKLEHDITFIRALAWKIKDES